MQHLEWNLIWTVCYLVVLLGLSAFGIHRYVIIYLFLKNRHKLPKARGQFPQLPKVTVQLPIYNELYVVERLLESVSRLDYPRELLEIQVLDDSTDETREIARRRSDALRREGFNIKLIQRNNREGFKAGALEEGLKQAESEFIFILDADFVPEPDILHRTVHYFTDPEIGMVQTRWGHINRTYSILTRVQSMFLDGHLLLEQTARSRSGRFFNFNGTAGLWRRSCIENSGGWQHDTLTEDLDLSYRAQLLGWKFVFLADVVTPAELPVDLNGFKCQQHRWTKGSVQTCKKLLLPLWKSKAPLRIKLEGTAHLTSNFAYLLLVFLCLLLQPASAGPHGMWRTFLLDIPIFVAASLSVVFFYVCAQRELYPKTWMTEMLFMPLLLALGIGLSLNNARAVLEAIFDHKSEFTRTPKYGIERRTQKWSASKYVPLKSVLVLLELVASVYFSYLVFMATLNEQFTSLPFLMLFQIGFIYVSFSSLRLWLPRGVQGGGDPAVAAS